MRNTTSKRLSSASDITPFRFSDSVRLVSQLPLAGFAAAATVVRAGSEQTMPALATDTICSSMASSSACWSAPILSNSSMQHSPLSARISAPASRANSPDASRTTEAVRPAAEELLPHT